MSPSLIHDPIRKLPLWQDGFAHGRNLGLRIALEVIVAAGVNQEQRANRTDPPTPANAPLRECAQGGGRPGSSPIPAVTPRPGRHFALCSWASA
jgi:hypothetical protein